MLICRRNFFPLSRRRWRNFQSTASAAVNELRSCLRNFFFERILWMPSLEGLIVKASSTMDARATIPSARNKVASRLFIDRAATPTEEASRGGESGALTRQGVFPKLSHKFRL